MSFIEKGQTYGFDQILSGTGHKIISFDVPQGTTLKRGDAINSSGALSDGTDLYGIVLEDSDGSTKETRTTVVVAGEVVFEFLNVKAGTTATAFKKAARNFGILVKELGGKA